MFFSREFILLLALGSVGVFGAPLADPNPKAEAAPADYGDVSLFSASLISPKANSC